MKKGDEWLDCWIGNRKEMEIKRNFLSWISEPAPFVFDNPNKN